MQVVVVALVAAVAAAAVAAAALVFGGKVIMDPLDGEVLLGVIE